MSDQPKPHGHPAFEPFNYPPLREQLAAEREKDELHAVALQVIERHHQKQLAAARQPIERTLEAAYENHREDIAKREADYTRELNAKLDQINAQTKTIRELVVAVKRMQGAAMDELFSEIQAIGDAALAKVGTYPLPDGRTK